MKLRSRKKNKLAIPAEGKKTPFSKTAVFMKKIGLFSFLISLILSFASAFLLPFLSKAKGEDQRLYWAGLAYCLIFFLFSMNGALFYRFGPSLASQGGKDREEPVYTAK
jgi:hypothetical protein